MSASWKMLNIQDLSDQKREVKLVTKRLNFFKELQPHTKMVISDEEAISSPPGSIFAEIRCCPVNERRLIACSGLLLGLSVSEEDEKVMCRFCPQHGTKVYSCIIFRCWSTRKQACAYRIFIAIAFVYTIVIVSLIIRKNMS